MNEITPIVFARTYPVNIVRSGEQYLEWVQAWKKDWHLLVAAIRAARSRMRDGSQDCVYRQRYANQRNQLRAEARSMLQDRTEAKAESIEARDAARAAKAA